MGIREADEKPFFQVFTESIERNEEDRYEVKLPFKNNHPILHHNYNLSEQRLMKLHEKQNRELLIEKLESNEIEPLLEEKSTTNYY